jgi:hypothetical protein
MPIPPSDLLDIATRRLSEFDIRLTRLSAPSAITFTGLNEASEATKVRLKSGHVTATYLAVTARHLSLMSLPLDSLSPTTRLLAIGEHIDARTAASFREAGIQYVDARGNAFIRFDHVHLEVHGRRTRLDEISPGDLDPATRRPANLFSTRRSQVIMCLLAWPSLWTAKVRDIATTAGVSTGQAHDSLAVLEQAGFPRHLTDDRRQRHLLLDLWTGAYPTGLSTQLSLADFVGTPDRHVNGTDDGPGPWLSGEVAAGIDLARPRTATYYVDDLDPMLPVVNRWRRAPETSPNIHVRRAFWSTPPTWVAGDREAAEARNAPWPLVYADLRATGDARLTQVATSWRDRHV